MFVAFFNCNTTNSIEDEQMSSGYRGSSYGDSNCNAKKMLEKSVWNTQFSRGSIV